MRSIAFALDPDGYWVEIIGQNPVAKTEGIKETNVESYRFVRPRPRPRSRARVATTASKRAGLMTKYGMCRTTRCCG